MVAGDDVSLVVPTYNRADALRANLPAMLALRGVNEVIVVNDGSSDDTVQVCRESGDARVRVISHPVNRGVAVARNTGVAEATGAWVLFGEDDCRFPPEYALALRDEAARHGADIVGAPLLQLRGTDEDAAKLAQRSPRRETPPTMDDVSVFPTQAIETPFLPARVLVRRAVFDRLRYYEGYSVNGYREETDFFVQAARAGFRCLLTSRTYCYQLGNWDGGQHHSSALRYEYWTLLNNWRFLRRHGSWLVAQGHIRGVVAAQVRFSGQRALIVANGVSKARIAAVRRWLYRHLSRSD